MKWSAITLVSRRGELVENAIKSVLAYGPDDYHIYMDPNSEANREELEDIVGLNMTQKTKITEIDYFEDLGSRRENLVLAFHEAISNARRSLVINVDDDDELIDPRPLLNIAEEDENVGLVFGNRIVNRKYDSIHQTGYVPKDARGIPSILPSIILYNRDAFKEIRQNIDVYHNSRVYGDHWTYWMDYKIAYWIRRAGYRIAHADEVTGLINRKADRTQVRAHLGGRWGEQADQLELLASDFEKPKVLVLEWNLNDFYWWRQRIQLMSMAPYCDIQVVKFGAYQIEEEPWFKLTEIEAPLNWLTYKDQLTYAQRVMMEVDDFDVIYVRNGGPRRQMLDVMISNMSGMPLVMKLGGNGFQVRRNVNLAGSYLPLLFQDTLDKLALKAVDYLVPVSSNLVEPYKWLGDKVLPPINLAIDTAHFHPMRATPIVWADQVYGFAGRWAPEKGIRFMEKLMELLPEESFNVAGRIDVETYSFPNNCHYSGQLTYEQMPEWYMRTTVGILPSFSEGCANNILENYAMGRPVIVTPQARTPEIPLFGWELPHDLGEWINLIKNMDPVEVQEKGRQAREYMCSSWMTWEDFGRKMAGVLQYAHREKKKQ